ncbi:toll/interleukin-1 receptor domain-containing protein [Pseudogemmobacter bohemicus]|uniref:toll/interleukin-1 receptor domain-containing protein n=1 Tax=Pseudogemmobacter bohemicus TaxID=2250708 RepID=UPI001300541F|nr:toll/interleukin-1 receptor domain-containing protein [Pseudogemmobacter bohemicus]
MTRPDFPSRHSVFLSYAREDLPLARQIALALETEGLTVAMDVTDIVPGEDWQARINQLLRGAAKVVFLATPASLLSAACKEELEAARAAGKPVLPLLSAGLPREELPDWLRNLHYTRLGSGAGITAEIASLATALRINIDWERRKAGYLLQAVGEQPLIRDRKDLALAESWAMDRPENAAPVPSAIAEMLARSRQRLQRRTRLGLLALAALVAVFAGLSGFAALQWRSQARATAEAEKQAALRVSGPAGDLLAQGRGLGALYLLHEAVTVLQDVTPVEPQMHVALRAALQNAAGQSRIAIANDLVLLDLGGTLLLQDPADGALMRIGAGGPEDSGVKMPGEILAWDFVPALDSGILVRRLDGQLLFQRFDTTTLAAGPVLLTLAIPAEEAPVLTITMAPDGVILVRGHEAEKDYYYEKAPPYQALSAWVADLQSGRSLRMQDLPDALRNDRAGRSYLTFNRRAPPLRFDQGSGSLVAFGPQEAAPDQRDIYYTCFRHHLADPDLELMIDRMGESYRDDLTATAYGIFTPQCRVTGKWLATISGRTSQSGFWKDIAIFNREVLLDRDNGLREEGFFSPEEGAAFRRLPVLANLGLPHLLQTGDNDPLFASFDGRALYGSFSMESMVNDAPIAGATLITETLAAWVETPVDTGRREIILIDLAEAKKTPFREIDPNPPPRGSGDDPLAARAEDKAAPTDITLADGSIFTAADRDALHLAEWDLIAVPGQPALIASGWREEVLRITRAPDGNWQRSILLALELPLSVRAISNDGSLMAVMLSGATVGSNAVVVYSTRDGSRVEPLATGSGGDIYPFGHSGFAEDGRFGSPDDELIYTRFPDYLGYRAALEQAILQLCPTWPANDCS